MTAVWPALHTCFPPLTIRGAGHNPGHYPKNSARTRADTCPGHAHPSFLSPKTDARTREYAFRMPANRVLVNTPAPQGSTGITTNVFPSMTLGCGAVAGNITSDNVGPQHLINIKRLAYVVRKPEEAFEMPLDYNAAHTAAPAGLVGPIDRNAVVAAV